MMKNIGLLIIAFVFFALLVGFIIAMAFFLNRYEKIYPALNDLKGS